MIDVARDFTPYPAGRHREDGRYSGEAFREDMLYPALKSGQTVKVVLDGAMGYGSSFLEEAFAGLVREHGFKVSELNERLILQSDDPLLKEEIRSYILDAAQQQLYGVDAN